MAALPHPWGAYERLQQELQGTKPLTSSSWGIEAAMDRIVADAALGIVTSAADIARARETGSRRERHRASLSRRYIFAADHGSDGLESTLQLAQMRATLAGKDWSLLARLAAGQSYSEIVMTDGGSPGALRVRVNRLRARFRSDDCAGSITTKVARA